MFDKFPIKNLKNSVSVFHIECFFTFSIAVRFLKMHSILQKFPSLKSHVSYYLIIVLNQNYLFLFQIRLFSDMTNEYK